MNPTDYDVVVVSAWGRGAYIAQKLKEQHFKVSVLDLSSRLMMSSVEREGPFGVFVPEHLSDEDRLYLCGDNYYKIPQGFCSVTPQKVIEFRGHLKHSPLDTSLRQSFNLALSSFRNKHLVNKNFQHDWNAPYILRESSFQFFDSLWKSWDTFGIRRLEIQHLKNIIFKKNRVYLQTDRGEVISRLLVWTLGALETKACCGNVLDLLFSSDWKEPKVWQRFKVSWDCGIFRDVIPRLMLIIPSFSTSNMGVNIMSFKQNPEETQTSGDLWMLCPYLSKRDQYVHQAERDLKMLFPGFSIQVNTIQVNARDFSSFSIKNRQVFFVQYEKNDIQKQVQNRHPLVFHLNPERVGRIDSYSLFQWEKELKLKLLKKLRFMHDRAI